MDTVHAIVAIFRWLFPVIALHALSVSIGGLPKRTLGAHPAPVCGLAVIRVGHFAIRRVVRARRPTRAVKSVGSDGRLAGQGLHVGV